MIELCDICCQYEDHVALEDACLQVGQGESVALIGQNGSGKSTLLKVLAGIVIPRSGSYRLDGRSVDGPFLKDPVASKAFHRRVGFLFQNSDAQLFCPSVEEELAFGPQQMGLSKDEIAHRVISLARLLRIEALLGRPSFRLSEGEKRRVALAAVLSLNPEILVLDEALNGLDPRTKRALLELLEGLKAAGKTLIASTHDFGAGQGLFDRAVVFSGEHRIAANGPYDEIVADTSLLHLHNIL